MADKVRGQPQQLSIATKPNLVSADPAKLLSISNGTEESKEWDFPDQFEQSASGVCLFLFIAFPFFFFCLENDTYNFFSVVNLFCYLLLLLY